VVVRAQNGTDQIGSVVAGFLAGNPQDRESLPRDLGEKLLKIAGEVAPDLKARGLAEDVVQEMFQLLLTRPADHYDPERGSPWAYLRTIIWLAARDIRAKESPAGVPRRPKRNEDGGFDSARPPLPLDDTLAPGCVVEDPEDCALARIGAAALIGAIPAKAPTWLPIALSLVVEGMTVTETAGALRISRFALRRALRHWAVPRAEVLRSAPQPPC
jgi:DNA-directed RNA polymerase specialized sigma24 family protein